MKKSFPVGDFWKQKGSKRKHTGLAGVNSGAAGSGCGWREFCFLEGSVFESAGEGETNAVGLIFGQIKASGIPALIRLEFLTNKIAASGKNLFGSGKR